MFLKEHVIFNWQYWLVVFYTFEMVHGKTTYEWHTDDMQVHTSDIQLSYEHIPAGAQPDIF